MNILLQKYLDVNKTHEKRYEHTKIVKKNSEYYFSSIHFKINH